MALPTPMAKFRFCGWRLLREMLKASAPNRADAEIWITEVARRVEQKQGHVVTEQDAAKALVKIYTMAIAQGIARTQWFEAQDPIGEDQGFGLLARNGAARASYTAFKTLTTHLGAVPKYQGWLALGREGKGCGFVFQGKSAPVLVAWMPRGHAGKTLAFAGDVQVIEPLSGAATMRGAGQPVALTDSPVLVVGLPADLLKEAQTNATKNFPWGGDYSTAEAVGCEPANPVGNRGIFQVHRDSTPTVTFADGSTGVLVRGDIGQAVSFYVHPSFASFQTKEYYIRVRVRRVAPGNVGMNLFYEVADSQGRTPYKNRGQWFGVAKDTGWQTYTWHVTDACFARMWGYDFSLPPGAVRTIRHRQGRGQHGAVQIGVHVNPADPREGDRPPIHRAGIARTAPTSRPGHRNSRGFGTRGFFRRTQHGAQPPQPARRPAASHRGVLVSGMKGDHPKVRFIVSLVVLAALGAALLGQAAGWRLRVQLQRRHADRRRNPFEGQNAFLDGERLAGLAHHHLVAHRRGLWTRRRVGQVDGPGGCPRQAFPLDGRGRAAGYQRRVRAAQRAEVRRDRAASR